MKTVLRVCATGDGMKILSAGGLSYVRFPASQMGVYLDNIGDNLAKPHTAAEVLALCPEAEAVLDGPMFEIADGTGEYAKYKKGKLDYRYLDTHDGDNASGGTATDRKGCTLSIVGGVPGWSDGDSVAPGSSVAIQFYPTLVRQGVVVASATVNTSKVWRAGVGSIGNDIVFAVMVGTMAEFAIALLALGCLDAAYGDGGGSARLAVREAGVPSRGSSENRRVPSWITCEPNRAR